MLSLTQPIVDILPVSLFGDEVTERAVAAAALLAVSFDRVVIDFVSRRLVDIGYGELSVTPVSATQRTSGGEEDGASEAGTSGFAKALSLARSRFTDASAAEDR